MSMHTKPLLIGESFSPWTKKARWALEFCRIAYDYQEYTPTLSEPGLRWKLKQWSGAVSVPILFVEQQIFRGSWEIAQYANATAGSNRLGNMDAISAWNDLSESALAEGRTRVVRCILQNKHALQESLPGFVPKPIRGALSFVARDAVRRLDRKYANLARPGATRNALIRAREGLAASENDFLLADFSYADIVMAVVLEVVAPIAKVEPPLGSATQACWNNASLADEFEDLLQWRDRLAASSETSYSQF